MMKRPERILLRTLLAPGLSVASKLRDIAAMIDHGAVFICPTETIYGIGGSIEVPDVREKIYLAKRRGHDTPLIVIAAERKSLEPLSLVFPPAAEALAKAFWPGKVTLILPSLFEPNGIAVRVSDHPFITALSRHCKVPLYSTSANISGIPYRNDPDLIFSQFTGTVDFMVDAGTLPESMPSTIVRVRENNKVTIIREGIVPGEKIMAVSVQ